MTCFLDSDKSDWILVKERKRPGTGIFQLNTTKESEHYNNQVHLYKVRDNKVSNIIEHQSQNTNITYFFYRNCEIYSLCH